jgi:hypothetical protein
LPRSQSGQGHASGGCGCRIGGPEQIDDIRQLNWDVDKAFPAAIFLVCGLIVAEVDSEGRIHLADRSRQHHGLPCGAGFDITQACGCRISFVNSSRDMYWRELTGVEA